LFLKGQQLKTFLEQFSDHDLMAMLIIYIEGWKQKRVKCCWIKQKIITLLHSPIVKYSSEHNLISLLALLWKFIKCYCT